MAKKKPHDPAAATRAAFERREREAEIARLIAQGATVTTDRAGHVISAYRSNCFNLLLSRGTITTNQYYAAHRLALDWAAWKGIDGKPDGVKERVDEEIGNSRALVTDRMLHAGRRVAEAMRQLGVAERRVIEGLLIATVEEDRPMEWRGIVERQVGETRKPKQVDLVVGALEHLREHYETPLTQNRVAA